MEEECAGEFIEPERNDLSSLFVAFHVWIGVIDSLFLLRMRIRMRMGMGLGRKGRRGKSSLGIEESGKWWGVWDREMRRRSGQRHTGHSG